MSLDYRWKNVKFEDEDYRYGFQGQEVDKDIFGKYSAVSFKYRIHNPAIGKFLSVDPLAPEYPWNSTYAFAENRVIDGIDLEGLEYVSATQAGFSNDLNGPYTPEQEERQKQYSSYIDYNNTSYYNGQLYFNVGQDLYQLSDGTISNQNSNGATRMTEWIYTDKGPTIPETQFIGWGDNVGGSSCDDCFSCCTMQLDQVGLITSGSNHRIQISSNSGVASESVRYEGISYIHRALENGEAIRVGVDYNGQNTANATGYVLNGGTDSRTDHFVTVVGRGKDSNGVFFRIYENATGAGGSFGTAGRNGTQTSIPLLSGGSEPTNKIYLQSNGLWTGNSIWQDNLTITQVRPNTNQISNP